MAATRLNKGQVFTPDFVASIALFSLFLIMFGVVWNTSIDLFVDESNVEEVQHDYTFSLLRTQGYPHDWNTSNVEIPGLYTENGFLSAEKFKEFYDLGVGDQRRVLRADDFYMRLKYLNGTTVSYQGNEMEAFSGPDFTDSRPVPQNKTVYASRKLAVLEENGKRVELRYYTWPN